MLSIQFHKDIANEVVSFDGLWLLGAGLGLTPLLERIISGYEQHKELVVVLNIEPSRFSPLFAERHPLIVAEGITAEQRFEEASSLSLLSLTHRLDGLAIFAEALYLLQVEYWWWTCCANAFLGT